MTPKKGLSRQAYEALPEGQRYEPYVPASESLVEFTAKAVIPGILFGILFGAANAYLGLNAGLTISTSIPVAVMTVAAFRAMRSVGVKSSILEANMSQTIGSASSSVASGVIFTLPAFFLWQMNLPLVQMTLLAMCGGLLGVLFMIPLRRFLIDKEHGKLPYPEGTACAEVLVATEVGGGHARNVFLGIAVGGIAKAVFALGKFFKSDVDFRIPFLPKAQLGMEMSAALFGVGYILGPRIGAVMVGGGLLSFLVIIPIIAVWGADRATPLYPETVQLIKDMSPSLMWNRYVRYIGAGAVATAGFITLIKSVPTMVNSFRIGAAQLKARLGEESGPELRTDRDLPLKAVLIGAGIIAVVMAFVPQVFEAIDSLAIRVVASILVVIFAFFFVTVASRIVGLVGVTSNPTSGMTIAALLGTTSVFLLMGWTDNTGKAAAVCVGCVVAIAASISGDTSQDLKTGFLLGATPYRQQVGEIIGVLTTAIFVCWTVQWMSGDILSGKLPAPQANLVRLVVDGVLAQSLPWVLVGIGAGIAILAEICRLPSLPFAVGVYLPVETMMTVFLGGCLRWFVERRASTPELAAEGREKGVLFGSGLVGGEGLMGVAIAGFAFYTLDENAKRGVEPPDPTHWLIPASMTNPDTILLIKNLAALAVFGVLVWYFARRCRANGSERA